MNTWTDEMLNVASAALARYSLTLRMGSDPYKATLKALGEVCTETVQRAAEKDKYDGPNWVTDQPTLWT